MNVSDKLKFILKAPISFGLSKKYSMPEVMEDGETLDYILKNGVSVCRYGDGEFNLMKGVGIKFQIFDEDLSVRLNQIAAAPAKENVLVCLPNIFKSLDGFEDEIRRWMRNHLRCTRGYWYKAFRNSFYGDALITRFYVENSNRDRDEYVRNLKSIWQNKRLLIVEGKKSRMGMGNDLFSDAKSIKRLLCPSANAFGAYGVILSEVEKLIETGEFDQVICALGPTATVLCYDLADKIQALDLGHMDVEYEWYLCKAKTKQAINNKSVTEVTDDCGDVVDAAYESQIVGEII